MPQTKVALSENEIKLLEKEWKRIDTLYSNSIASLANLSSDLLTRAHKIFFEKEKRDVFYRAARILLSKAVNGQIDMSVADVLEILLQTWNRQYYRFHPWTNQHHSDIESLLNDYQKQITAISDKHILSCREGLSGDEGWIWMMFIRFKTVLGPVGAAKSLHLLAPAYFPLWDRTIAKGAYHVPLNQTGYLTMMRLIKTQLMNISQAHVQDITLLKLIDEYNYCRYTQSWI